MHPVPAFAGSELKFADLTAMRGGGGRLSVGFCSRSTLVVLFLAKCMTTKYEVLDPYG